ncbi:hypothetical protein PPTG_24819 [Phytophthora nicotianae INRA-310]|uniref:Uncharacterized protein n=1 Tax=Phytophthora nicotianae (strain INRA-310) TaxID=761204 RepID=W2PC86_PHYN3|nr:hypothetical protein PPTG_24819 [Phytophthora nicotianae INRA-310]ETM97813.1 hypothetical protein PPTG_24819 [Phytophthora nicotianae INRA-310]
MLKKSIDEKAGVEEMDDGADANGQEDEEDEQPDFSFEYEGDDGLCNTSCSMDSTASTHSAIGTDTYHHNGCDDESNTPIGSIDELLESAAVREGLEAFASTPRPSPNPSTSTQRHLRSAGLPKPTQPPVVGSSVISLEKPSTTRARASEGSKRYLNAWNRLGGSNLEDFRSTIWRKRDANDDDELAEASYAKVKRVKATRMATQLKKRLSDLETGSSAMGNNIVELTILMREDSERKGEARRADEEQRRRDEVAAREARYHAEKLEAEERRRQEKVEMEDRARREKEEARARSQELMFFIGALFKKE